MSRATARIKGVIAVLTGDDKPRGRDHGAQSPSKAVAEKMKDVAKDAIDDLCDAANKRSR